MSIIFLDGLEVFEIPSSSITFGDALGEGQFGKVFEGHMMSAASTGSPLRVAVKMLGDGLDISEQNSFLKEALRMTKFNHPHIVRLLGVCFKETPSFIVLEHMSGGDLKQYLRDSCQDGHTAPTVSHEELLEISRQIASAMVYLAEVPYVHRDIAARNVLIDGSQCYKLSDFGLCFQIVLIFNKRNQWLNFQSSIVEVIIICPSF